MYSLTKVLDWHVSAITRHKLCLRMKIKTLSAVPSAIPEIAEWYFGEWGHFNPALSSVKISESLKKYLQDDGLPQALVALEKDNPIGVAEIKYHELSIYPQYKHWLGGVFVKPEYRARFVGSALIQKALELAEFHNIDKLYLQTLRLDGGLYGRIGWENVEEFQHKGHSKLLMVYRF